MPRWQKPKPLRRTYALDSHHGGTARRRKVGPIAPHAPSTGAPGGPMGDGGPCRIIQPEGREHGYSAYFEHRRLPVCGPGSTSKSWPAGWATPAPQSRRTSTSTGSSSATGPGLRRWQACFSGPEEAVGGLALGPGAEQQGADHVGRELVLCLGHRLVEVDVPLTEPAVGLGPVAQAMGCHDRGAAPTGGSSTSPSSTARDLPPARRRSRSRAKGSGCAHVPCSRGGATESSVTVLVTLSGGEMAPSS